MAGVVGRAGGGPRVLVKAPNPHSSSHVLCMEDVLDQQAWVTCWTTRCVREREDLWLRAWWCCGHRRKPGTRGQPEGGVGTRGSDKASFPAHVLPCWASIWRSLI